MIQSHPQDVDAYAAAAAAAAVASVNPATAAAYNHQFPQVNSRLNPLDQPHSVSPLYHHQHHHHQHGHHYQQQQHQQQHLHHQPMPAKREAISPATMGLTHSMQQTQNLSPLAGARQQVHHHQTQVTKSQQLSLTISENSAAAAVTSTNKLIGEASNSPKTFANTNNNNNKSNNPIINSPASISMQLGVCARRQSSSVVSTASSVGSNLSDHQSPNDSPSSVVHQNNPSVLTMQTNQLDKNSLALVEDRLVTAAGLATDNEQDSKESQLSQLHQQCADLLDEQQQQHQFVAINSPNNEGTNASNSGSINQQQQSNNGNNTNNNSNGNNGRNKRLRTSFKHHQLKEMKKWFAQNQNPDAKDLKTLAHATGLSKRVLQVSE